MKRLLIFGLMIFLSSCAIIQENLNVPKFSSIQEASHWIYVNFEYRHTEYYYTPEQIIQRRWGDCYDMTEALIYICYIQFGYIGQKVSVCNNHHAVAYIEEQYYDPTWDRIGWQSKY